jgi:serine/threonine protein kinase
MDTKVSESLDDAQDQSSSKKNKVFKNAQHVLSATGQKKGGGKQGVVYRLTALTINGVLIDQPKKFAIKETSCPDTNAASLPDIYKAAYGDTYSDDEYHMMSATTWTENGKTYCLQPFIPGHILTHYNEANFDKKKNVAKALVQKIRTLHLAQFAHGDIKHDNIIFNDSGEVFLIDFGHTADLEEPITSKNLLIFEYFLRTKKQQDIMALALLVLCILYDQSVVEIIQYHMARASLFNYFKFFFCKIFNITCRRSLPYWTENFIHNEQLVQFLSTVYSGRAEVAFEDEPIRYLKNFEDFIAQVKPSDMTVVAQRPYLGIVSTIVTIGLLSLSVLGLSFYVNGHNLYTMIALLSITMMLTMVLCMNIISYNAKKNIDYNMEYVQKILIHTIILKGVLVILSALIIALLVYQCTMHQSVIVLIATSILWLACAPSYCGTHAQLTSDYTIQPSEKAMTGDTFTTF